MKTKGPIETFIYFAAWWLPTCLFFSVVTHSSTVGYVVATGILVFTTWAAWVVEKEEKKKK